MARASNRHTSEELFITIKAMTKAGLTAKEICKIMKVGEPRVLCCRKFDTYEEYIDGRHDVYEGWSGDSRKTHKKGEKAKRVAAAENDVKQREDDINMDDLLDGMKRKTKESHKNNPDEVIIQLLMRISEQLAIIVGELT